MGVLLSTNTKLKVAAASKLEIENTEIDSNLETLKSREGKGEKAIIF